MPKRCMGLRFYKERVCVLCALDLERASRDMLVSVFDDEDVLSPVLNHVGHVKHVAARVLNVNLVTGTFRTIKGHKEDVVACQKKQKMNSGKQHCR